MLQKDAAMADVGTFKGTGGSAWMLDLPLSEPLRDQAVKGDLVPVDEQARAYVAELRGDTPAPEPEPEPEPEADEPDPVADPVGEVVELVRPPDAGPGSSRKAWAAYAEQQGVTVSDDDTRDDIIAKIDGG